MNGLPHLSIGLYLKINGKIGIKKPEFSLHHLKGETNMSVRCCSRIPFSIEFFSLPCRTRFLDRWKQSRFFHIFYMLAWKVREFHMGKKPRPAHKIIWIEIAAFGTIIAISWANEWGLENFLFGESYMRDWKDPIMQTVITILVAIPTIIFSWRLSKKLHYLEGFLRVCSWCQKVGQGDDWISIEDYVANTLNSKTTHGICPSCLLKLKEE